MMKPGMPRSLSSRTPRPSIKTLSGNGFLRESPYNQAPAWWHVKSHAFMRRCMYLPAAPPELLAQLPRGSAPAPLPKAAPRHVDVEPGPPKARDPRRDVAIFAAVPVAAPVIGTAERARRALEADGRRRAVQGSPTATLDQPLVIGLLLFLVPPVGLAALWSSPRYTRDARWALTMTTSLAMCLAFGVVALLVRR